ncbi:MAG: glutamine synthetase [Alphaproteobacteria bacterium]|nr:glutamine synthetase [Alphaproteobacteria bacterium]
MTATQSTMAGALPDIERVREEHAKLEEAGVRYVFSCWIDMHGLPKTKPIPLSDFENLCMGKGPQFAVHSVSFVPELGPADSDQIPIPDLDSLIICPWDRSCAWMFADLWWENAPYNLCPRQTLKRAVRDTAAKGYTGFAGIEPEFIVMRWRDGRPVKAFDDDPLPGEGVRPRRQAFGYDIEYTIDSMGFLGPVIDILVELGWGLKDVVCEGSYSQIELDFGYTDLVGMADRLVFLRVLLKEVAKQRDLFVTYMPKPAIGDWRSGAHINYSMQRVDASGANFFEANGDWAPAAYHAVGGLLRHGAALTAITACTVNSYNGLVARVPGFEGGVYTWAPTHMTYGNNNRSAMLRLPQNRFCIENRATDLCMNPYLALAMTTASAVDGVTGEIDPGPPLNKDLYSLSDEEILAHGGQRLPRNLLEATEKLNEDPLAAEVLGPALLKSWSEYKFNEWERYHQAVTDWEVQEYLRLY